MPDRSSKKRSDLNQIAKSIVDETTAEASEEEVRAKAIAEGKNPAAVLLGRLGGLKGGKAKRSLGYEVLIFGNEITEGAVSFFSKDGL
jgi:hypothetical protein